MRWLGAAVVVVSLTACNPAISKVRGEVVSVTERGDEMEVCVSAPKDVGSTYDRKEPTDPECESGVIEGDRPRVGDCVILRLQGESPELRVTAASGCKG
jgi:hypothetical protein